MGIFKLFVTLAIPLAFTAMASAADEPPAGVAVNLSSFDCLFIKGKTYQNLRFEKVGKRRMQSLRFISNDESQGTMSEFMVHDCVALANPKNQIEQIECARYSREKAENNSKFILKKKEYSEIYDFIEHKPTSEEAAEDTLEDNETVLASGLECNIQHAKIGN